MGKNKPLNIVGYWKFPGRARKMPTIPTPPPPRSLISSNGWKSALALWISPYNFDNNQHYERSRILKHELRNIKDKRFAIIQKTLPDYSKLISFIIPGAFIGCRYWFRFVDNMKMFCYKIFSRNYDKISTINYGKILAVSVLFILISLFSGGYIDF